MKSAKPAAATEGQADRTHAAPRDERDEEEIGEEKDQQMSWYKVTLSPSEVVAWKHMRLQESFEASFLRFHAPKDAGMFSGIHGAFTNMYFFSPGAVQIAKPLIDSYAGIACEAPKRSQVAMLVVRDGGDAIPFAPETAPTPED